MSLGSDCSPGANIKSDKNAITAKFTITEASGIPIDYSHELNCLYQFLEREEKHVVPALEYRNGVHRFQHSQTFKINKELMEFIENDTLGIQVWGSMEPSTLIVEGVGMYYSINSVNKIMIILLLYSVQCFNNHYTCQK